MPRALLRRSLVPRHPRSARSLRSDHSRSMRRRHRRARDRSDRKLATIHRAPGPEKSRGGAQLHLRLPERSKSRIERSTTTGAHTADNGDHPERPPDAGGGLTTSKPTRSPAFPQKMRALPLQQRGSDGSDGARQQRQKQRQACCTPRARTSATCNIPARTRCTARRKP